MENYRKFNKYQTQLTDEVLSKLNKEAQADLFEAIDAIMFIQNLASVDRKRARDLPRWDNPALPLTRDDSGVVRQKDPNGRIEVDITNPHILEDMDFFRGPAIHFKKHGKYTNLFPNRNPNSEYFKFWKEEARRCREGYTRPSDGEWVPGFFYFYLNYSPILKVEVIDGTQRAGRVEDFPNPYDGDYLFFHYLEQARNAGKHTATLKKRGSGFSFKGGSKMARNFILGESEVARHKVKSYAVANEKEYLTKDGVLNKFLAIADFCAVHTAFPGERTLKDSLNDMHWKMGRKDNKTGTDVGTLNEVMGVTLKNDPEKARGKRGSLMEWEEAGKFDNFLVAWGIARPSVEEDGFAFGIMNAYGCVCEGTKVMTKGGASVNIEDLRQRDGILGFNVGNGVVEEKIEYVKPEQKKPCVRIVTNTGRELECSTDHPILWGRKDYGSNLRLKADPEKRKFVKKLKFVPAVNIVVGDQIAIAQGIDRFGCLEMWNPRLVGLLIGDGSYGVNKTPMLSNCDKEVNNYVESNFNTVVEKEAKTKDGRDYKEIRIRGIAKELRELGIYGQTGKNKRLPINHDQYSKDDIIEMISGLYDSDGHYDCKGKYTRIVLTSSSKGMLIEVLLLLQRFDINGNINEIKVTPKEGSKSKNNYFVLEVRDSESLLNFSKTFRPMIEYKKEALLSIAEKSSKISPMKSDSPFLKNIIMERVVSCELIGDRYVYNITASGTHTYIANGIITHNTGGTEGAAFDGLEEIFYNGDGYNIYSIPNVFDKNTGGKGRCSFFFGTYMNFKGKYDKDGNSDVIGALILTVKDRLKTKYGASDPNAIVQKKAENPITPQEAIMRTEGSAFPVGDLRDYLEEIMPSIDRFVDEHWVGRLTYNDKGEVVFNPDASLTPIREFPYVVKGGKSDGGVEIFDMPQKDRDGKIFSGRYIAGTDPIDNDYTANGSLASTFVFDLWNDKIVAEYTARPVLAEEFYETTLRLASFFNAEINYESNLKGMFTYFSNNNALHLLCDTPEIIKDIYISKTVLHGNRQKGTRTTKEVIKLGKTLQRQWQLSQFEIELYDDTTGEIQTTFIQNLRRIRSIGYIKECIAWNQDINADRVSAMDMVMILREDRAKMVDKFEDKGTIDVYAKTGDEFLDQNWQKAMDSMSRSKNPWD